jgi:flagellar hook-length control protein FliK
MKVQQLAQGPKSSSPSRPAKAGAADGKSPDFADVLTDARKKPQAAPEKTDAPAAKKKPPVSKKAKTSKNETEGDAEETAVVEQDADAKVAGDTTPAEGDEPVAEADTDTPKSEDKESDDALVVPAAAAYSIAQQSAPALNADDPAAQLDTNVTRAGATPQPVAPRPVAGSMIDAPAVEEELADTVIAGDGDDEVEAEPAMAFNDLAAMADDEPVVEATKSAAKVAAAPIIAAEDAEPAKPEKSTNQKQNDAKPIGVTSDVAIPTDIPEDDAAQAAPVKHSVADASATAPAMHVQPEIAKTQATATSPAAPAPLPPQAQFVEANHPKIVTAMRAELMPQGGTMQIRLDPPELGALQVLVHMHDGVMTASFQTSNDNATKLLSHSLSQLKQVLESQGVSVEKLQVQQAPRDQQAQHDDPNQQHQRDQHGDAHRQEQQRKEMIRRMWRRISNGSDPLDLVA